MSNEQIQNFFDKQHAKEEEVKIKFKKRTTLSGVFIAGNDYADLKSKNFWRVVTSVHLEEWKQSKNINLSKIFNGNDFSSLALAAKNN